MIDIRAGAGTRLYAIVGHPLTHTLSPPMHNAAFRTLGIAAVYVPHPVEPGCLPAALRRLMEGGAEGLNVTAPFKAEALALTDVVDPTASRAGGVNTIRVIDGRLHGWSTDGAGFLRDLETAGWSAPGRRVVLYGGGAAARAVGSSLVDAGAAITVVVREPARAGWVPAIGGRVVAWEGQETASALEGADLVVQATTLGRDGASTPPVDWDRVRPTTFVVDLLYEPRFTPFLAAARRRGCIVRNGLGMLLAQGAAAFEIWFGIPAPLEEMAGAIGHRLASR